VCRSLGSPAVSHTPELHPYANVIGRPRACFQAGGLAPAVSLFDPHRPTTPSANQCSRRG
jgi:hypothetical protein